MIKIAIVGGGPGGVSLCMQLNKQLVQTNLQKHVEIIVFEKTPHIGFGLPYSAPEDCHILNLPKEVMEPVSGERNKFARWQAEMFDYANQTSFPPRHHFGKYLESMAIRTQLEGEVDGLTISYLTENEVFDIQEQQNGTFIILAAHGSYVVHYVILSTGHMPSICLLSLLVMKDTYIILGI